MRIFQCEDFAILPLTLTRRTTDLQRASSGAVGGAHAETGTAEEHAEGDAEGDATGDEKGHASGRR